MEMLAKQTPAASSEMVKLIRKLRWVGLEEKAELLAKEVEQQPATDTVLAIQSEQTSKRPRASLCDSVTLLVGARNWPSLWRARSQRRISKKRQQSAARHA